MPLSFCIYFQGRKAALKCLFFKMTSNSNVIVSKNHLLDFACVCQAPLIIFFRLIKSNNQEKGISDIKKKKGLSKYSPF